MWMPILARTGSSTPSSMKVAWPSLGAMQGVAGRDDHVHRLEQLRAPSRDTSGGISARDRPRGAGTIAPAIRRSRTAGSKSFGAFAQAIEMQRRAFGGGDDVGRGAGARGLGNFDRRVWRRAPWRRARRPRCLRENVLLEIAAGNRDPQAGDPCDQQRQSPARPAASRTPGRRHRGPAWRHRPARDRATLRANGPR